MGGSRFQLPLCSPGLISPEVKAVINTRPGNSCGQCVAHPTARRSKATPRSAKETQKPFSPIRFVNENFLYWENVLRGVPAGRGRAGSARRAMLGAAGPRGQGRGRAGRWRRAGRARRRPRAPLARAVGAAPRRPRSQVRAPGGGGAVLCWAGGMQSCGRWWGRLAARGAPHLWAAAAGQRRWGGGEAARCIEQLLPRHDDFSRRHIGPREQEKREMLRTVGVQVGAVRGGSCAAGPSRCGLRSPAGANHGVRALLAERRGADGQNHPGQHPPPEAAEDG